MPCPIMSLPGFPHEESYQTRIWCAWHVNLYFRVGPYLIIVHIYNISGKCYQLDMLLGHHHIVSCIQEAMTHRKASRVGRHALRSRCNTLKHEVPRAQTFTSKPSLWYVTKKHDILGIVHCLTFFQTQLFGKEMFPLSGLRTKGFKVQ
jgi:hypothetical protein